MPCVRIRLVRSSVCWLRSFTADAGALPPFCLSFPFSDYCCPLTQNPLLQKNRPNFSSRPKSGQSRYFAFAANLVTHGQRHTFCLGHLPLLPREMPPHEPSRDSRKRQVSKWPERSCDKFEGLARNGAIHVTRMKRSLVCEAEDGMTYMAPCGLPADSCV